MIQHFVWWAFLLGVVAGIVGIYYVRPSISSILRYPVPQDIDKLVYRDKSGICYKYSAKEVNCDANENKLKSFPLS